MDNNKQSAPVNTYVPGKIILKARIARINTIEWFFFFFLVEPIESKMYVPPSERPVGVEPHKYTGSAIPSRSFRMLQAMTGQNNGKVNNFPY